MRHADDDEEMRLASASGKYGYAQHIGNSVEASVRKMTKFAGKTAHALWSKDPKTAEFLTTHARKADSLPAKALIAAMSDLGPKVAKVAAQRTHGLYGFRSKTAQRALVACQAMREESGHLAHELTSRKPTKYSEIVGYLEKYCGETSCPYATLLQQAMPDDEFSMLRTAQDSGAGSAAHMFFDNPRKRVVREFAWTKAISNVPSVVPKVVKEYEETDESKRKLQQQVNKTPDTPDEALKVTPGSDDFSTLARYIVFTEEPTDAGVPEGHEDIDKAPDLSIVHDLVTEKYLKKLAARRG